MRCFQDLGIAVNGLSICTGVEKTRTLGGLEEVVSKREGDKAGKSQDEEREELALLRVSCQSIPNYNIGG